MLSSLLYLGAGLALSIVLAIRPRTAEAPLRGADWARLAIIALLGGAVAPVLMLSGLRRTSGVAGSLLLNLEAPFTIVLALVFFREHAGAKVLAAAALIVAGGALLGLPATDGFAQVDPLGAAMIAGACACWAIDNNLSQRLSSRDPLTTVRIKALSAGVLTLVLAIAFGESRPVSPVIAGALLLGSASYGLSIVLDDEHHQHAHDRASPPIAPDEPHSHPHRHVALTHDHPHTPDLHHRHRH